MVKEAFNYLGEHLASYGIAAVSVEHLSSNSDYELEILEGAKTRAIASPEFIERSLNIYYVIRSLNLELLEREYDDILPVILPTLNY